MYRIAATSRLCQIWNAHSDFRTIGTKKRIWAWFYLEQWISFIGNAVSGSCIQSQQEKQKVAHSTYEPAGPSEVHTVTCDVWHTAIAGSRAIKVINGTASLAIPILPRPAAVRITNCLLAFSGQKAHRLSGISFRIFFTVSRFYHSKWVPDLIVSDYDWLLTYL